MTLRVAHIGWLASSHLERRASALAKRGVPTVVFTDKIPGHLKSEKLPFHVEIFPLLSDNDPFELVAWLEKKLTTHCIDLLHIHSTHFPAALGFFVRTLPKLTSIWDFVYSKDSVSPLFHKVFLEELFSGRLSEAISFSSKVILDQWIEKGFPVSRGFWHSWGVDLDQFSMTRDETRINALKNELGIKPGEHVIFSPRTPSLPANVDLILQALPLLKNAENIKCIVTGHALPPEARYLERFMGQKDIWDKVRFVDPIHDQATLSLYYQMADLVVSLHSNDHNPATVLESMAAGGTLVINESPTVEYWIQDGQNGFVAQTRDIGHLVSKLNQGLALSPQIKAEWRRFNRSKIENEANFHKTIGQVIENYEAVVRIPCIPECNDFHKGLLHDICRCNKKAKWYYELEPEYKAGLPFIARLIDEKKDFLNPQNRCAHFHEQRACTPLFNLQNKDRDTWGRLLDQLEYPNHLFRHDMVAGFFPLMKEGRYGDLLYLISLLANRFHTGVLEWVSECINWFGGCWAMWSECSGLLLSIKEGGVTLGVHALNVSEKLGKSDKSYLALLERGRRWTQGSIAGISPGLDYRFRQAVYDESSCRIMSDGLRHDGPSIKQCKRFSPEICAE